MKRTSLGAIPAGLAGSFCGVIFALNSMHLEHIELNIDKRQEASGLQAKLRPGATEDAIAAVELRMGHRFPLQVREFYSKWNGLTVDGPLFEILPVNELAVDDRFRIHFATVDGTHRISFDCSRINEAEQWDIIDSETGNRITFTMASLWSNTIWKWIDHRLEFWRGEV